MAEEEDRHKTMSSQELARERTSLAAERTTLANQRTFSAWLRTGLSSVLAGLAIVKFIGDEEVFKGYVLMTGLIFVVIGIAIYIFAYLTYKDSIKEDMEEGQDVGAYFTIMSLITLGMIVAAAMIAVLLIFY